jgi:hypothetical protein
MIYKSKIKYRPKLISKKIGGKKPENRNKKDLINIVKKYLEENKGLFINDDQIKDYISKITNKEFDEMKINKSEKQVLRKLNDPKDELSLYENIKYAASLLHQIDSKLKNAEFIKTAEENKTKLLEEMEIYKKEKEEISEKKFEIMKDVKKYLNIKKIEVSKKKELDEILYVYHNYNKVINIYNDTIPKLTKELDLEEQLLENLREKINIQIENKLLNKETVELFEKKKIYIAQLKKDIPIMEKTKEFLLLTLNNKLEDVCICDSDDINCQEWLDSIKKSVQ